MFICFRIVLIYIELQQNNFVCCVNFSITHKPLRLMWWISIILLSYKNTVKFCSFLFLQMCFNLIAMFHFIEINILSIDNNKILNYLFYLNRYYWTEHFWSFLQSVWLNLQKVCLMMKVAQQNKTTLIKNLRFVSLNKAIKPV